MTRYRLALVAILLVLGIGMPAASARATERGAVLVAEGTTTTMAGGQQLPASRQREAVIIGGAGFQPGEAIGVWNTFPDGSVFGIDDDDIVADADGVFAIELGLGSGLPVGIHRVSARGQASGAGAIVAFYLLPGAGPAPTSSARLAVAPAAARQLETVALTGAGFDAGESVAVWLTLPDGVVLGLGRIDAASDGTFAVELGLSPFLPVGRHVFTAQGVDSDTTAMSAFTLQYGNGLDVPGAQLAADIGRAPQRTVLEISAEGFEGDESVSFWLTLPDGSVLPLGDVRADDGNLDVVLYLSEDLPTGTHYLSFVSNVSGQASFAKLVLEPGPQTPGEE